MKGELKVSKLQELVYQAGETMNLLWKVVRGAVD